jgi:glutamine amidotransferase
VIAVVDYGMGNLHSVAKAFEAAGADVTVTADPDDLRSAERIVLPGQGAFRDCAAQLRASGLLEALEDEVRTKGKPMFGICLGLQLLGTESNEGGRHAGLGWFPATVERLVPSGPEFRVPHIGWNDLVPTVPSPLWRRLKAETIVYFDHSYHFVPRDRSIVAATSDHGGAFVAAIQSGNIFATQFHPEKSQAAGLRLIEDFLRWSP